MPEKKQVPTTDGWRPSIKQGYQPSTTKKMPVPAGNKITGGYQPPKSEAKPAPVAPPKKP